MSSSRKKKILIIDDDETLKEALTLLFLDEGFEVDTLASGHELNSVLKVSKPDIILTDYLMPGKSGAEITKELRRNKITKNTPIIMMAATRHYNAIGIEAGVDKFIVKPFDIDYLLRLINSYLD